MSAPPASDSFHVDPLGVCAALERMHSRLVEHRLDSCEQVLAAALPDLLAVTGANLGYICLVSRERRRDRPPSLILGTIKATSEDASGAMTLWVYDLFHEVIPKEGLPRPLAELATSTAAIILDYEPLLSAIDNFMSVPVCVDGELVALFGLSNRRGGFDESMVESLAPLVRGCQVVLKQFVMRARLVEMGGELERAQRRFDSFMTASRFVAYLSDSEGHIRWISEAFGRQFNVDREQVVGRPEHKLLPASVAARARSIDEQVRESERIVEVLEPAVGGDGEIHWWKGAKFPVEGPGGEPMIGSLAQDVTETVGMTETLREREAELAEAQDLGRLGRWTWVVGRDRVGWDAHFERLCGLPSTDEHTLDTLMGLLHPDDVEPTRLALEDAARAGTKRFVFEHRLLVGGQVRELSVVGRVRREGDAGAVVSAVVHDVTEQRVLERARLTLEGRAHEFDSLAVLTGAMAQEFDGLLVGVLGNAGIALDELDPDSLAAVCVQDIEASAERAVQLTHEMLAFSERGKDEPEEADLSAIIVGCAEAIHAVIFDAINLRLSLYPELPQISVDVGQLRQLVLGLVRNASEAMGELGGELALTTGVDDFGVEELVNLAPGCTLDPGRYVWVEVSDTGGGIEAQVERIFEPFFSTKFTSRGLGLAAVRAIVRTHGGALLVENSPGRGVVFRALFPPLGSAEEDSESWVSSRAD